jgi:hypothetical protein
MDKACSEVEVVSLLRPPISHMIVPAKGINPNENRVMSHPIMFVIGTAISTPVDTPNARPHSLMPFNKGSSFGLNHSIIIALVAGMVIATPIPNMSLIITSKGKESTNGVSKCADINNPASVIALLEPILAINNPPGNRDIVTIIIVADTKRLTELLPILYSPIIVVNNGVGDMKFKPIPTCRSISIDWIIQR